MNRLFLGIDLNGDDRAALAAFLAPLSPFPGRPVPPSNWHLTVRFLGETTPVQADRLLAALDEGELGGPFSLRLAGLGAFPNPDRAAVLWMGVEAPENRLAELNRMAERLARDLGFEAEERPYHPHLTLSRVRPPEDVWSILEAEPEFPRPIFVEHVTLFETRFGSGGAHYEVVDRVGL